MRRRSYSCGLEFVFAMIGGQWKPLILWQLSSGPRRFNELRRASPGISEKILVKQLREMESDGVVTRKDYQEVPPHVEYSLTDFGDSLREVLAPVCEWGTVHAEGRLEV